ncbi:TadE/TadG family type IV pilus assembly protein [Nocardioides solisilvae]|uniref:TadE/TadG family type IV pilus assembly protein n=1 Tax=Nocardioides solisilvae TaxID=1542435 RepID=UPI00194F6820|nr:TadE/TadG family type IV pilus assembly protein [Nocardioides solisilvae]
MSPHVLDRRPSARRRDEGGAAAVEFALVMPMLLLLVFGMVQYGLYFWSAQGGATAAREAARRAAVGDLASCSAFQADVRDRIDSLGDAGGATVTRTYTKGAGNSGTDVQVGDLVTVTVQFTSIDLGIPLIPFMDDGLVTQSADSRVEGVPDASVGDCT